MNTAVPIPQRLDWADFDGYGLNFQELGTKKEGKKASAFLIFKQ